MKILSAVFVTLVFLIVPTVAQDEEGDERIKQLNKWTDYYQEVANSYNIRLASAPETRMEVTTKPVHSYANPSSGYDSHGAIFVWTARGRAQAIGAIWSRQTEPGSLERSVNHEFQSLATEAFSATCPDLRWNPSSPGVKFVELKGFPKPSVSRRLRLAQMRAISRKFKGYHIHPVERQLRVLPQPLYRYKESDDENIESEDGALFCLFQEWDPEIMLLIEARKENSNGELAWYFSAGRFSNKPLRLELDGTVVWDYPNQDLGGPQEPFYAVLGVTTRPATLD
jgi:hypothetical protein